MRIILFLLWFYHKPVLFVCFQRLVEFVEIDEIEREGNRNCQLKLREMKVNLAKGTNP